MDKISLQGTEDIYAKALQKITAVVKKSAAQRVYCRGEGLQYSVETIFEFYCKLLAYGLKKMGTKSYRYAQLAIITINDNVLNGEELFEILTKQKHTGKDEIKKFTLAKGPIVPEVIEVIKYFFKKMSHQQTITNENTSRDILGRMVETGIEFLEQHEVYEPLVFFCENFSIMLGWLAGYFARYIEVPSAVILKSGINVLQLVDIPPTMATEVSSHKVATLLQISLTTPCARLDTRLASAF